MRKVTSFLVTFLLANIITIGAFAQNVTINGNVRNSSTTEGSGAVSVIVKGEDNGTFTDDKGNFITIPAEELRRQKVKALTLEATLYRSIPLQQSTGEGGKMTLRYTLKPVKIKLGE